MPVYKDNKKVTSDGRCWFFKINYTDIFGNNKQITRRSWKTKAEAKEAEAEFIRGLHDYKDNNTQITFKDLFTRYVDFQSDKVRPSTKQRYKYNSKYLEKFFNMKCCEITADHFEEWKREMNQTQLGTRTKNDILKLFKAILNYGMTWQELNFKNLYRRISNFKNPTELKKEMQFYTYDEFVQYLDQEDISVYRCLWKTLYFCGLRCSEARGVTWKDVDFKKKLLHINKQVLDTHKNGMWVFADTKTRDSNRIIPICDSLYDELVSYHKEVMKFKNYNDGFFVFGLTGGVTPFAPSTVRYRNSEIAERANLKQIRLHDFRHSCASLLINSNASITMVAKYLGHTKIDVTLNTYSHMFQGALDGVINVINDANKTDK